MVMASKQAKLRINDCRKFDRSILLLGAYSFIKYNFYCKYFKYELQLRIYPIILNSMKFTSNKGISLVGKLF